MNTKLDLNEDFIITSGEGGQIKTPNLASGQEDVLALNSEVQPCIDVVNKHFTESTWNEPQVDVDRVSRHSSIHFKTNVFGVDKPCSIQAFTVHSSNTIDPPGQVYLSIVKSSDTSKALSTSRQVDMSNKNTDYIFIFDNICKLETNVEYEFVWHTDKDDTSTRAGTAILVSKDYGSQQDIYYDGVPNRRPICFVKFIYTDTWLASIDYVDNAISEFQPAGDYLTEEDLQEIEAENLVTEKSIVGLGGSIEFKEGSSIVVEKGDNEVKIVVKDGETTDELTIPQKTGTIAIDEDIPFEKGSSPYSARQKQEVGKENTASQPGSFAQGANTTASGQNSHAEGGDNITGKTTPDEGDELLYSKAEGYASHSEGAGHAIGRYSHAEGGGNVVVEGFKTRPTAEGGYSHAEGTHTWAKADNSHAEGAQTIVEGTAGHVEGRNNVISTDQTKLQLAVPTNSENPVAYSHAEGNGNRVSGQNSHVEGKGNIVSSDNCHAEGQRTNVSARGAHVEGVGATDNGVVTDYGAQAVASHVEGIRCIAKSDAQGGHAEGLETQVTNPSEHAQGRYNVSHRVASSSFPSAGNTIHSIGIGTSTNRMNAVEVMQDGKVYVKGVGNYDGKNPTDSETKDIATIINDIPSQINEKIAKIQTFQKEILSQLPDEEDADDKTIYLIPQSGGETPNLCDEYVIVENGNSRRWEKIGGVTIDLDDFYTKDETDAKTLLTPIYSELPPFSEWTIPDYTNDSYGGKLMGVSWDDDNGCWSFYFELDAYPVESATDPDALSVSANLDGTTVTATRTGVPCYTLGDQTDKPLASEAEVAANRDAISSLNDTKLDKIRLVSWSELKALRDNGNLIPGQQYRITDYVATSNGDMNSRSANKPFDIIVTADDECSLNEKARAIMHETVLDFSTDTQYAVGDYCKYNDVVYKCTTTHNGTWDSNDFTEESPYFYGCNLAAWEVWYCLDNDTNRFAWALADGVTDSQTQTTGKGIIYRLIDEFNNDVPYDFKGIQFQRWPITSITSYVSINDVKSKIIADPDGNLDDIKFISYIDSNVSNGAYTLQVNSNVSSWYFTFDMGGTIEPPRFGEIDSSKDGYSNNVINNIIKQYDINQIRHLNNIVFMGENSSFNEIKNNCYANTFLNASHTLFVKNCYYNIICGNYNKMKEKCYKCICIGGKNEFDDNCYENIISGSSNKFGDWCYHCALGDSSYNNVFGIHCNGNILYKGCIYNNFSRYSADNELRSGCDYNEFGYNSYHNYISSNCQKNIFEMDNRYVYINSSYCQYITIESGVGFLKIECTASRGNAVYCQNITVAKGFRTNLSNYTRIEDPNYNQQFKTTYQPADSQVISI